LGSLTKAKLLTLIGLNLALVGPKQGKTWFLRAGSGMT